MAPCPLGRVVIDGARAPAFRAVETLPLAMRHVHVDLAFVEGELHLLHVPWRGDAEDCLVELYVVHARKTARPDRLRSTSTHSNPGRA